MEAIMIGLGIVKAVTGTVKVIAVDGVERILQVGHKVFLGEQIITGNDGAIVVEFSDGDLIDLGRNSGVTLNEEAQVSEQGYKQENPTLEEYAQADVAEVQRVLIEDETFDPSELDAPAAGVAVANGEIEDDGYTVVQVDFLNSTMTPDSGFDTSGVSVVSTEPLEELLLEPDSLFPTFIMPPTVALSLEAHIKESSTDNVINLNANVDNPGADLLQTITLSQLPADASLDLTGLTSAVGVASWTGDGVNAPLVLILDAGVTSLFGSFKLSLLKGSDVDITGILVTAVAVNADIPTLKASASDSFDVVVDAILDEQADIDQVQEALDNPNFFGGEAIVLNLELSMVDALFLGSLDGGSDEDGSENVSSVVITLDDTRADLIFEQYNGSAILVEDNSTGVYTLEGYTDTADLYVAIESLAIITPSAPDVYFYDGIIKGTIKTITEDTNPSGGLEPDLVDNSRVGVFDFYVRVGDEFDGFLDTKSTGIDVGFRITGPSLILDSANGQDLDFSIDFSQLLSNPVIHNKLSDIDKVVISGNIDTQENNQISLSAQGVLDFNQQDPLQSLSIVGNAGDQVNLIDQDGVGLGSWSIVSYNAIAQTVTYSYLNNAQIIANITVDDALTVVM